MFKSKLKSDCETGVCSKCINLWVYFRINIKKKNHQVGISPVRPVPVKVIFLWPVIPNCSWLGCENSVQLKLQKSMEKISLIAKSAQMQGAPSKSTWSLHEPCNFTHYRFLCFQVAATITYSEFQRQNIHQSESTKVGSAA